MWPDCLPMTHVIVSDRLQARRRPTSSFFQCNPEVWPSPHPLWMLEQLHSWFHTPKTSFLRQCNPCKRLVTAPRFQFGASLTHPHLLTVLIVIHCFLLSSPAGCLPNVVRHQQQQQQQPGHIQELTARFEEKKKTNKILSQTAGRRKKKKTLRMRSGMVIKHRALHKGSLMSAPWCSNCVAKPPSVATHPPDCFRSS